MEEMIHRLLPICSEPSTESEVLSPDGSYGTHLGVAAERVSWVVTNKKGDAEQVSDQLQAFHVTRKATERSCIIA
jgi:hypothetical protein